MRITKFTTLFIAFTILLILFACSEDDYLTDVAQQEGEESAALGELTIGLMPAIDSFPIVIAHYRDYFADEGLIVNLEPFSSPSDRDAALQAGHLDATLFDLVAVGLFHEADIIPLRAGGSTTGRFSLVADAGFETIADLAGETVVIAQNTAIDFILDQMIELAGFDEYHIETLAIPAIPARLEYLRAGNVAAALLPEPWATIAIAEGFYEITNTIEIGVNPFVIAFTDEAVATMPEEIRAFYRAYDRAVDYLNTNDLADYFYIMVDIIGFPEEVADDLILPSFTHNQMPEDHVLDAALSWLLARDLITEGMTTADLVNSVAFD